jgi:hypothetical protein
MVDGGPWDNATINDTLHFITPNSDEVLLMTGYFPSPTAAGILIVSRGIEGLKDIAALGNLSTESPTVVPFATSGYTDCQRTDIGKPVKRNGSLLDDKTVLIAYNNDIRKWWLSRPHNVSIGDVLTVDGGQGTGTRDNRTNDFMNTGGGAVMIGKGYERFDDPPRICLTNGDTLYITAGSSVGVGADAVTANLKVKDLTTTGNVTVNGNLICTGPITGLVTHVAAILDNTLRAIGDYIGLNPNAAATFAGMTLNGALQVNAPSQTGITLGNGTIYWQTSTNPNVLEMNCGLIIDGAVNAAGASINGTLGVTGQASANNFWINGSWLNSSSTLYIGGASGAAVTMYMNGNVNPISDNAYGLGSGSNRWQGIVAVNGYFNNLYPTGELRIPTSAPGSPQNGDIWLA